MPNYRFIQFSRSDGRADLTLNNPPDNLLHADMLDEIIEALEPLRDDETLKVLLIKSSGENFCRGAELPALTTENVGNFMPAYSRIYVFLSEIRGITLSAVQGEALGVGCELAGFCDITFAGVGAKFRFPEIEYGLFPPIASSFLPRAIGRNRALDWIISGREIAAQEASDAYLVTKILPDDRLQAAADEYAAMIATLSAPAVTCAKRAIDQSLDVPLTESIRVAESTYMIDLMNSIDPHEGLRAAIEGRKPVWRNR